MKISYRTTPVLQYLENGNIMEVGFDPQDTNSFMKLLGSLPDNYFKTITRNCSKNIFWLSKNFIDGFERVGNKLFETGLLDQLPVKGYCLLREAPLNTGHKDAFLIDIFEVSSVDQTVFFRFAHFCDEELFILKDMFVQHTVGGSYDVRLKDIFGYQSTGYNDIEGIVVNCLLIILFIHYAEIEYKTLGPNQRSKGILCKDVNNTKSSIKMLDIKHFTTIHQPNGFGVRGHFRWQAHGEGLKDRKLIWINDFVKDGYTAPARKLSANT
jgi:hypothetical protein